MMLEIKGTELINGFIVKCGSKFLRIPNEKEGETYCQITTNGDEATLFFDLNEAAEFAESVDGEVLVFIYKESLIYKFGKGGLNHG